MLQVIKRFTKSDFCVDGGIIMFYLPKRVYCISFMTQNMMVLSLCMCGACSYYRN